MMTSLETRLFALELPPPEGLVVRAMAAAGAPPKGRPFHAPAAARPILVGAVVVLLLVSGLAALFAWPRGAGGPHLGVADVLAKARDVSATGDVPGIGRFTLTVRDTLVATVDGRDKTVSEIETRRWVDRPRRWRTELRVRHHDGAGNRTGSDLVRVVVSDGTTEWKYFSGERWNNGTIESGDTLETHPVAAIDPANTSLGMGMLSWTTGSTSVTALLDAAMSCYTPTLRGMEHLLGRPAYVIDLGPSRCATPSPSLPAGAKAVTFAPLTVWVDAATFLTLKWLGRSDIPNMAEISEIVQLDLDPTIDPGTFTYSGPRP